MFMFEMLKSKALGCKHGRNHLYVKGFVDLYFIWKAMNACNKKIILIFLIMLMKLARITHARTCNTMTLFKQLCNILVIELFLKSHYVMQTHILIG